MTKLTESEKEFVIGLLESLQRKYAKSATNLEIMMGNDIRKAEKNNKSFLTKVGLRKKESIDCILIDKTNINAYKAIAESIKKVIQKLRG